MNINFTEFVKILYNRSEEYIDKFYPFVKKLFKEANRNIKITDYMLKNWFREKNQNQSYIKKFSGKKFNNDKFIALLKKQYNDNWENLQIDFMRIEKYHIIDKDISDGDLFLESIMLQFKALIKIPDKKIPTKWYDNLKIEKDVLKQDNADPVQDSEVDGIYFMLLQIMLERNPNKIWERIKDKNPSDELNSLFSEYKKLFDIREPIRELFNSFNSDFEYKEPSDKINKYILELNEWFEQTPFFDERAQKAINNFLEESDNIKYPIGIFKQIELRLNIEEILNLKYDLKDELIKKLMAKYEFNVLLAPEDEASLSGENETL